MDVFSAIFSLIIVILVIYGISRVAHYFNNTNKKLNEIDKKLNEIKAFQNKKK
jgi:Na+-transporting methylmalonyl-CoA/oxaloacetate decarboxylase gamma subunit